MMIFPPILNVYYPMKLTMQIVFSQPSLIIFTKVPIFWPWRVYIYIYNWFRFMHLADAFIQATYNCIQVIHFNQYIVPWNRTHNLLRCDAMLYHWAQQEHIYNEEFICKNRNSVFNNFQKYTYMHLVSISFHVTTLKKWHFAIISSVLSHDKI